MTRLSRYSLARALLRAAERHDVSPATTAALVAAAASVVVDALRDARTPHRHAMALARALEGAEGLLDAKGAVH